MGGVILSIEKLELVSIVGELPHLNDAIVACLQSKTFHLENAAKLLGSSGSEELDKAKPAIKLLGGKTEKVIEYTLPGGDARTLILIRKTGETPAKYPRNAGQIKKKPLG